MGSPEKCDKCGGVGSHVEGKRGFTRFPCPNATPTPPAPADDASGAEAMRAEFADLLATWIPDADERRRAAHAVVERIHNAPLPARDDAVEEAAEALCDYLDKTSGGEEWKGSSLVRRLRAALRREKGGA